MDTWCDSDSSFTSTNHRNETCLLVINFYVVSFTNSKKQKDKEDQEQEDPNDLRDPAMEQRERLLAVDEELLDEEDKEIMKNEAPVPKDRREDINGPCTRKLISIDETSKVLFILMCSLYREIEMIVLFRFGWPIIQLKKVVGRALISGGRRGTPTCKTRGMFVRTFELNPLKETKLVLV